MQELLRLLAAWKGIELEDGYQPLLQQFPLPSG